jgi:hypothetical protein
MRQEKSAAKGVFYQNEKKKTPLLCQNHNDRRRDLHAEDVDNPFNKLWRRMATEN